MRKDLKIGMAIGAVLLVVLIVYVAVPKNEPGTEVAQNAGADEQVTETEQAPAEEPVADQAPTEVVKETTPAGGTEDAVAGNAGEKEDPFAPQGGMWANILKSGQ